jgi:hypothetical protein
VQTTRQPRAQWQAEIKIVVGNSEMFGFEAVHGFEHGATHDHAGAGHRRDAARMAQHAAMAGIVARGASAQVAGDRPRADGHAGMLQHSMG